MNDNSTNVDQNYINHELTASANIKKSFAEKESTNIDDQIMEL